MAKKAAPKQEEPIEKQMWKAADKLRKNIDAAEYKHIVLGLIFLKYISDAFDELYEKLQQGEGDYAGADPEDKDEYKAENVFFVPETARWSYLLTQARQPDIGKTVDAAMDADDEDKADALQEDGEALGEQLQALEEGLQGYGANVKAAAGAIVTIDRNGEAVIHRGLLREAEAKALRTLEKLRQGFSDPDAANDDEGEEDEQPKAAAISDRLAQRLSAHRTAALQIEVAQHPQVALAALVHGMVQSVLQDNHYGHDLPLGVSLKVQDRLEGMAPDWPESPAAVAQRELQQVAGEALPQDSAELFVALLAMEQGELVRLLAVCVAATVDVVTPRATAHQPGAELAQAVGLDMAAWWQPTADGYFQHVPKAAILEAVGEFAPSHAARLAKLKKADIASEAERLADGTGWMPAIFRTESPQQDAQAVAVDAGAEAPEEVAAVADELPQAEALAA
jgi:ParB family chromosome partitioning protein